MHLFWVHSTTRGTWGATGATGATGPVGPITHDHTAEITEVIEVSQEQVKTLGDAEQNLEKMEKWNEAENEFTNKTSSPEAVSTV